MLSKTFKLLLFILAALVAPACETVRECSPNCLSDEQILAKTGAQRLTPEQVRAHVSGKTEDWIHGGAYYHADGRLDARWLKVGYQGSWEVSADGVLCYDLPKWQRRCHFYMDRAGEIYLLDEGENIGVRSTYEGNRLRDLGRTLKSQGTIE